MTHRLTGNRILGAIALVIGALWLHYSGSYLFEMVKNTGFDGGQFFLLLLVLGGLVFTLFGFSQLVYREEYFIGEGRVAWKRLGLRGMRSWQESLSDYSGVLKEQHYHGYPETHAPNYQSRMSYTLFLLKSGSKYEKLN